VYFEAGAAVITLVLLGKLLEARAKAGTSAALEGLMRLQPKTAHLLRDGTTSDVSLSQIGIGDRFVVRAGESIPVDGVVRDGSSSVDESMLTGESVASAKTAGAKVFAGTINQEGMLTCEATGVGSSTLLAGIVRLVAEAQGSKAPIQRLADKVSGVFVPVVVVIAALTFALTDGAVVSYLVSEVYNPGIERGIDPLDPEIGLVIPDDLGVPLLSEKDRDAPSLADARERGELPDWSEARTFYDNLGSGVRR
jgi:Cu+-exporting ATPase